MSFTYNMKRSGPKTDPWGTPLGTGAHSDFDPLRTKVLHSFRTLGCSPSGPGALSVWILYSFFLSSVNVISVTHSLVLWWNAGILGWWTYLRIQPLI